MIMTTRYIRLAEKKSRISACGGSPSEFAGQGGRNVNPTPLRKAWSPPALPARAAELAARPRPGRAWRLGCGRLGGEVSGDRGQFRVGPRREHLAYPQVEFVLAERARTKAALTMSITCSRSACDTRRRPRAAAAAATPSPGPATIAAPNPVRFKGKRSALPRLHEAPLALDLLVEDRFGQLPRLATLPAQISCDFSPRQVRRPWTARPSPTDARA